MPRPPPLWPPPRTATVSPLSRPKLTALMTSATSGSGRSGADIGRSCRYRPAARRHSRGRRARSADRAGVPSGPGSPLLSDRTRRSGAASTTAMTSSPTFTAGDVWSPTVGRLARVALAKRYADCARHAASTARASIRSGVATPSSNQAHLCSRSWRPSAYLAWPCHSRARLVATRSSIAFAAW